MFGKRNASHQRTLAIELCHSSFSAAIHSTTSKGVENTLSFTTQWRNESQTLRSDAGKREFSKALRTFVVEHGLQNAHLTITLSGDFCVTRVVSGDAQHVRRELAEIEQRSSLYLTLGHGQKAVGASIHKVSSQRQHALLSVVNQRTLDVLLEAAAFAHLVLDRIEPSLVSVARVVGKLKTDSEQPVLIVNVAERGVELGISLEGRLLLDYRPAGSDSRENVANVVAGHLNRLRRYCQRYVQLENSELTTAVLCGDARGVDLVKKAFDENDLLTVLPLHSLVNEENWNLDTKNLSGDQVAALGASLLEDRFNTTDAGPNLMERLHALHREPLAPQLARTFWPLAATVLFAVILWLHVEKVDRETTVLAKELESHEVVQQRSRILRHQTISNTEKIKHLELLARNISTPRWREMTTTVSQCLPNDVWVEAISVSDGKQMRISGEAYTEDGIFEFVRSLEQFPSLRQVSLMGTRPARTSAGPSTRFDVSCEIINQPDSPEAAPDGNN